MARFSLSLPESLSQTDRDKSGTSILRLGDSLDPGLGCDREWLGFHTILEFERVQVIVVMFHACLVLEILILQSEAAAHTNFRVAGW